MNYTVMIFLCFFLPLSGMSSSKAHCIVQHQKAPDLQLVSPKPRCGSSVYKLREQKRDVQQWTASLARRGRWNVAIVVSFSLSPHQREVVVIRSELLYFSSRIFLSRAQQKIFPQWNGSNIFHGRSFKGSQSDGATRCSSPRKNRNLLCFSI